MSKQEHTPGPWKWASDWGLLPDSPLKDEYGDLKYAGLSLMAGSYPVVSMGIDHYELMIDVDESRDRTQTLVLPADRRLIEAAPDLLKDSKRLLDHYLDLVNCGDCGNWNPEKEDEVIAMRKSIALATGKGDTE